LEQPILPLVSLEESKPEGNLCSICFEELFEDQKMTPCNHSFHLLCILKWLKLKGECPLCRTKLKEDGDIIVLEVVNEQGNALNFPEPRSSARQILARISQIVLNGLNLFVMEPILFCLKFLFLFLYFFGYWMTFIAVLLFNNNECSAIVSIALEWSVGMYLSGILMVAFFKFLARDNVCGDCFYCTPATLTLTGWVILLYAVSLNLQCSL
jgi:hypothetical protein